MIESDEEMEEEEMSSVTTQTESRRWRRATRERVAYVGMCEVRIQRHRTNAAS
jgi:hypothetical protein